jgi:ABC-2 type transport system permease protein/oleandomycin transport system permease protein
MIAEQPLTRLELAPRVHAHPYWVAADTFVLARRQLRRILRVPDELVTSTLQPVLFVVLFRYIFGGAIAVRGTSYVNFLVAGILVQAVILGSAFTGIGIATDLQRGLVDRFRALPMAKSAVLSGRILADLVRSICILIIVWLTGLLVGFRPADSPTAWLAAIGLLLLGSLMFSWFSALVGLLLSSVEAVQQAFIVWALPLMFASSALVPTSTMPTWLQPFVNNQPVSLLIDAIRGLVLGHPDVAATWQAVVWCVGLLAIFVPVAVWAYGRRTAR